MFQNNFHAQAAGNSATQAQFDDQIADFVANVVPAWTADAQMYLGKKKLI